MAGADGELSKKKILFQVRRAPAIGKSKTRGRTAGRTGLNSGWAAGDPGQWKVQEHYRDKENNDRESSKESFASQN